MKLKDNYMHEVYKMLAYTESSQEIKERRDLLKTGQFAKKILIFDVRIPAQLSHFSNHPSRLPKTRLPPNFAADIRINPVKM